MWGITASPSQGGKWHKAHSCHSPSPRGPHPILDPQVEELRTQLRLLEDTRDGLRRELLEAQRKVRDSLEGYEAHCREAGELRRSLSEGTKEREALRRSNEELRAAVKKAESERIR